MQKIIFTNIPENEFKEMISAAIRSELAVNATPNHQAQSELISRKEAAKMLGITLPTLSDWTNKEIVKGYRIASRLRYKKEEILESLTQVKTVKYGGYKRS